MPRIWPNLTQPQPLGTHAWVLSHRYFIPWHRRPFFSRKAASLIFYLISRWQVFLWGGWELYIRSHLEQNKFIKMRPDMKSKFPTEEPVGLCNQNTVTVTRSVESMVRSCECRWVGLQLVPKAAHRGDRDTVLMLLRKAAIRWQEKGEVLNAAWGHLSNNDSLHPAPGVC